MKKISKGGSLLLLTFALFLLAPALSFGKPNRGTGRSFAYVSNTVSGYVSVIDTATNTVATTIVIGPTYLHGIAISPDGRYGYVATESGVSIIDTRTNTFTAAIQMGSDCQEIAFTHDGALAYVTDQGLNVVWVIDTATKRLVGQPIPVGNGATAIAITPDDAFAYVVNICGDSSCSGRSTVSIIDTSINQVTNTIQIGYWSNGIAITPNGAFAFVANQCEDNSCNTGQGTVSVISIASQEVVVTIPTGQASTQYVVFAPDGGLAYVSNTGANTVSIIDTATNSLVGSPISVGISPGGLGVTPDGRFIYVTNQCGNADGGCQWGSVSVIAADTREVIATVTVGQHPVWLAITSKGQKGRRM